MNAFSSFTILVSGHGSIGKRHAQNLRALDIEHIYTCDPHEEADYKDFKIALQETKPTIVFLCSPTKEHVSQALVAANAGCHLFIEKPLSHALDDLALLENIVQEKKLIAMVGCNMRFHPGPKKVKELLDGGRIGNVLRAYIETASYLPEWRPHQEYTQSYSADPVQGGAILDCIHEIDLALWYLGSAELKTAKVVSAESIGLPDTDGDATLELAHTSGAASTVHLSFVHHGHERNCRIEGKNGIITWAFGKEVKLIRKNGEVAESFAHSSDWEPNQMYREEVAYFLRCVQNRVTPFSSLKEGQAALRIALAAKNL